MSFAGGGGGGVVDKKMEPSASKIVNPSRSILHKGHTELRAFFSRERSLFSIIKAIQIES